MSRKRPQRYPVRPLIQLRLSVVPTFVLFYLSAFFSFSIPSIFACATFNSFPFHQACPFPLSASLPVWYSEPAMACVLPANLQLLLCLFWQRNIYGGDSRMLVKSVCFYVRTVRRPEWLCRANLIWGSDLVVE